MWETAKSNARSRGIVFTVSVTHVFDLLWAEVRSGRVAMKANDPRSASIDRVDSNRGYVRGNIQIVPHWYNRACRDWPKTEVLKAIREFMGSR